MTKTSFCENDDSSKRPVPVGIVTELPMFAESGAVWLREYLASLSTRQLARVTAIWTPEQISSQMINNEYFHGAPECFYGLGDEFVEASQTEDSGTLEKTQRTRRSLQALARGVGCQVEALVLLLSPERHAHILRELFALEGFNKHILSTDSGFCRAGGDDLLVRVVQARASSLSNSPVPTQCMTLQSAPLTKKSCDGASHWFVVGSLRFEPAVKSLCEMLPEIGSTVGGTLTGSMIPQPGHQLGSGSGTSMFELLVAFVALLRKVFGEIQSVSSEGFLESIDSTTIAENAETHARKGHVASFQVEVGSVKFVSGASCAITVMPSSPASIFNFTVHGSLGRLSLTWDNGKQCFELQRSLKHFEHPSLHPSLGHAWCFAGWLEAILQDIGHNQSTSHPPGSCYETLVDVTIANAMLESNGAIVNFRAVPLNPSAKVS